MSLLTLLSRKWSIQIREEGSRWGLMTVSRTPSLCHEEYSSCKGKDKEGPKPRDWGHTQEPFRRRRTGLALSKPIWIKGYGTFWPKKRETGDKAPCGPLAGAGAGAGRATVISAARPVGFQSSSFSSAALFRSRAPNWSPSALCSVFPLIFWTLPSQDVPYTLKHDVSIRNASPSPPAAPAPSSEVARWPLSQNHEISLRLSFCLIPVFDRSCCGESKGFEIRKSGAVFP